MRNRNLETLDFIPVYQLTASQFEPYESFHTIGHRSAPQPKKYMKVHYIIPLVYIVLDIDVKNCGDKVRIEEINKLSNFYSNETFVVQTQNKGFHIYFKLDDQNTYISKYKNDSDTYFEIKKSNYKTANIIASPTNKNYSVISGTNEIKTITESEFLEICKRFKQNVRRKEVASDDYSDEVQKFSRLHNDDQKNSLLQLNLSNAIRYINQQSMPDTGRNNKLFQIACQLRRYLIKDVYQFLTQYKFDFKGLDETEIYPTINSACENEPIPDTIPCVFDYNIKLDDIIQTNQGTVGVKKVDYVSKKLHFINGELKSIEFTEKQISTFDPHTLKETVNTLKIISKTTQKNYDIMLCQAISPFLETLSYDTFSKKVYAIKEIKYMDKHVYFHKEKNEEIPMDELMNFAKTWLMWNSETGYCIDDPHEDKLRTSLLMIAKCRSFSSAVKEFNSLKWDGVDRIDEVIKHLALENIEPNKKYYREAIRTWFKACVMRVYYAGYKFDNMLVFEGEQETRKSSLLKILANGHLDDEKLRRRKNRPSWFTDSRVMSKDKDDLAKLRGVLISEVSELEDIKTTSVEYVKTFLSQTEDNYRPPYARENEVFKRQNVFAGTVNPVKGVGYLKDVTGNRRFWVLPVSGQINTAWFENNRDLIFAQMRDEIFNEAKYLDYTKNKIKTLDPKVIEIKKKEMLENFDFLFKLELENRQIKDEDVITYIYPPRYVLDLSDEAKIILKSIQGKRTVKDLELEKGLDRLKLAFGEWYHIHLSNMEEGKEVGLDLLDMFCRINHLHINAYSTSGFKQSLIAERYQEIYDCITQLLLSKSHYKYILKAALPFSYDTIKGEMPFVKLKKNDWNIQIAVNKNKTLEDLFE